MLDASSARTQVGWLAAGDTATWHVATEEAGRALFLGAEALLSARKLRLWDVGAFVFCEGPGSMLGTRTVAMALRTWQVLESRPIYVYQSLAVAGVAEYRRRARAFAVIADARRDSWHVQSIAADGRPAALARVATTDVPAGELLTPEFFPQWSAAPGRPITPCSYELAGIFPNLGDADVFQPCATPDAFQHEAPEYKKWSVQVHSAEIAARK